VTGDFIVGNTHTVRQPSRVRGGKVIARRRAFSHGREMCANTCFVSISAQSCHTGHSLGACDHRTARNIPLDETDGILRQPLHGFHRRATRTSSGRTEHA
jgi:hypothetical protein